MRADGGVEKLGRPGTLLGPFREMRVCDESAGSAPATPSCSTPTASSRRAATATMFGERRLRAPCRGLAGRPADELVEGVERAVVSHHGGPLDDDLAILVLRVTP